MTQLLFTVQCRGLLAFKWSRRASEDEDIIITITIDIIIIVQVTA